MGTAAGVAWALKNQGKKGRVFLFCGDMSAETGIFHEAVKYVYNFDLPATFIVCDNGVSVMTDTQGRLGAMPNLGLRAPNTKIRSFILNTPMAIRIRALGN